MEDVNMLGLLIGSGIIGYVTAKCGYPIITDTGLFSFKGFIITFTVSTIWFCLYHILFNK